jgi:hypothetical protein
MERVVAALKGKYAGRMDFGMASARMNPKLADALAYDSSVTASVAMNVLAHTLDTIAGAPRKNPVEWK